MITPVPVGWPWSVVEGPGLVLRTSHHWRGYPNLLVVTSWAGVSSPAGWRRLCPGKSPVGTRVSSLKTFMGLEGEEEMGEPGGLL